MATYPEYRLLQKLASLSPGPIVEIGSYRGFSAVHLALGSRHPVYCVDPHKEFTGPLGAKIGPQDRQEFYRLVADQNLGHKIVLIGLPSDDAAVAFIEKKIGMVFIDGNHDLAVDDYDCWAHLIMTDGILAFHDRNYPKVVGAIIQAERDGWGVVDSVGSLIAMRRRDE